LGYGSFLGSCLGMLFGYVAGSGESFTELLLLSGKLLTRLACDCSEQSQNLWALLLRACGLALG